VTDRPPSPRIGLLPPQRFAPLGPGAREFWLAAADGIADWIGESSDSAHSPLAIVLPGGSLVATLQSALAERLGRVGRAWAPPPIRPLDQWLSQWAPVAPTSVLDGLARTLALLAALDEALPDRLAQHSVGERFAFADGLQQVLDALTLAGAQGRLNDPEWLAEVASRFGSPAAHEQLGEDLRLLARLQGLLGDAASAQIEREISRIRRLADLWVAAGTRVAWVAWQPPTPFEAILLDRLAARLPPGHLRRLAPDWGVLGEQAPLLQAAWPEFVGGLHGDTPDTELQESELPQRSLRERRLAWQRQAVGPVPEILHADDREREAQLAAQWVHRRLAADVAGGQPPGRIAIVALDRWLARRVRALLERAGVLIDDREGWLLSTTVAASAVMGWLDAVASDGHYDALLGWFDSPFVRPDMRPDGPGAMRAWVERCATRYGYLRGWQGLRRQGAQGASAASAEQGLRGNEPPAPPVALDRLLDAATAQRRHQPLREHLDRLAQVLGWVGARQRLAGDEAGRQVLAMLDSLRRAGAKADHDRVLSPAEFRGLLAAVLERHRFHGDATSPVQLLLPAQAAGQHFDAVLVMGAAEGLLPAPAPALALVNQPLRLMLGLPTAASSAACQQRDLVLLLALARESAITCRTDPGDGTRPSPWVERLEAIAADGPMSERILLPGQARPIEATPARQPSPSLFRLPDSLPVGAIEHLIDCPFRFLAQDGWRLREPPEAVDQPGRRERGQWVHEILERFHADASAGAIPFEPSSRDALRALLVRVTDEVADREMASGAGTLGELAEWRASLDGYLDWSITDAAGGWRFLAGEQEGALDVQWNDERGPRSVRLEGRLDRLDQGGAGLRVVDYKLGSPSRLQGIAAHPERAAQLALYGLIASRQGAVDKVGYLTVQRDGTQWLPLGGAAAEPVDDLIAPWRQQLPIYFARIDRGAPMPAIGSECVYCPVRGVCRKGHWS
jgi:ATP-dependent helicase/nuclease subunit B